ncbi:hypothetical protein HK099_002232 [Clydaea vesicula]|uniref:Uncharacterized protein n=1 Tax=Clydaea vesicula TaxID=447962 RepID=A0AAD5TT35_9FUNG|nr:hypothetical protein HK099_002232 [Clydaea vesicula]
MATTHAARCGSRMGLGITLLRYGLFIRSRDVEAELNEYRYYDPQSGETAEHLSSQNMWLSYLLMLIGFFMIIQSNLEYYRASKLRAVILTTEHRV